MAFKVFFEFLFLCVVVYFRNTKKAIKRFFQFLFLCVVVCSCEIETENLASSDLKKTELVFTEPEKNTASQKKSFKQSGEIYAGSPICSREEKCIQICKNLFSASSIQKDCYQLKAQQIYQIEKLYQLVLTKDPLELNKINAFDLKVFFGLSSKALFDFFNALDSRFIKIFLSWIAEDWKTAVVFQQEDTQFLYMQLFLNKLNYLPIRSLKETIKGDKTFVELSWLKQNDAALVWLNDYLAQIHCKPLQGEGLRLCLLEGYCVISDNFQPDILAEIDQFEDLAVLLQNENRFTGHFKDFCSQLCSSGNCMEEGGWKNGEV